MTSRSSSCAGKLSTLRATGLGPHTVKGGFLLPDEIRTADILCDDEEHVIDPESFPRRRSPFWRRKVRDVDLVFEVEVN
jgi:hypothetical protein